MRASAFSLVSGVALIACLCCPPSPRLTRAADAPAATEPAAEMSPLERQFQQTMTDAVMAGRFTVDGQDKPPTEEKYHIGSVKKMKGDLWLLNARIQYGEHDLTLPIVLAVKWAGNTPVITVDDLGFPGMGKFTARVLVFQDHYAGTWSGGPTHQGTLSGQIRHEAGATTQAAGQKE